MPAVGAYLRGLRERQGVSIDEIARSTRVLHHYLEALESDDLASLPAPVFAKGFIRAYCQALGVSADEAIALYDQRAGHVRERVTIAPAPPPPPRLIASAAAARSPGAGRSGRRAAAVGAGERCSSASCSSWSWALPCSPSPWRFSPGETRGTAPRRPRSAATARAGTGPDPGARAGDKRARSGARRRPAPETAAPDGAARRLVDGERGGRRAAGSGVCRAGARLGVRSASCRRIGSSRERRRRPGYAFAPRTGEPPRRRFRPTRFGSGCPTVPSSSRSATPEA